MRKVILRFAFVALGVWTALFGLFFLLSGPERIGLAAVRKNLARKGLGEVHVEGLDIRASGHFSFVNGKVAGTVTAASRVLEHLEVDIASAAGRLRWPPILRLWGRSLRGANRPLASWVPGSIGDIEQGVGNIRLTLANGERWHFDGVRLSLRHPSPRELDGTVSVAAIRRGGTEETWLRDVELKASLRDRGFSLELSSARCALGDLQAAAASSEAYRLGRELGALAEALEQGWSQRDLSALAAALETSAPRDLRLTATLLQDGAPYMWVFSERRKLELPRQLRLALDCDINGASGELQGAAGRYHAPPATLSWPALRIRLSREALAVDPVALEVALNHGAAGVVGLSAAGEARLDRSERPFWLRAAVTDAASAAETADMPVSGSAELCVWGALTPFWIEADGGADLLLALPGVAGLQPVSGAVQASLHDRHVRLEARKVRVGMGTLDADAAAELRDFTPVNLTVRLEAQQFPLVPGAPLAALLPLDATGAVSASLVAHAPQADLETATAAFSVVARLDEVAWRNAVYGPVTAAATGNAEAGIVLIEALEATTADGVLRFGGMLTAGGEIDGAYEFQTGRRLLSRALETAQMTAAAGWVENVRAADQARLASTGTIAGDIRAPRVAAAIEVEHVTWRDVVVRQIMSKVDWNGANIQVRELEARARPLNAGSHWSVLKGDAALVLLHPLDAAFNMAAAPFDLGLISAALGRDVRVQGLIHGVGKGRLHGGMEELDIELRAAQVDAGGIVLKNATGNLTGGRDRTALEMRADLPASGSARVAAELFADAPARVQARVSGLKTEQMPWLAAWMAGVADASLSARLPNAGVRRGGGDLRGWLLDGAADAALEYRGANGESLQGQLRVRPKSPLHVSLRAADVDLAAIPAAGGLAAGRVRAAASVQLPLPDWPHQSFAWRPWLSGLQGRIDAEAEPLSFQRIALSRASVGADLKGSAIAGVVRLASPPLEIAVNGDWSAPRVQFSGAWSELDLGWLIASATHPAALTHRGEIDATWYGGRDVRGVLISEGWKASAGGVTLEQQGRARLEFDGRSARLERAVVQSADAPGAVAVVSGVIPLDPAAADMDLRIELNNFDLAALDGRFTGVRRMDGRLQGTCALQGSLRDPSLIGAVAIAEGRVRLAALNQAISDIQLEARFEQDRVQLRHAEGRLAHGVLWASGELMLHRERMPEADLSLAFRDVRYNEVRDLTVEADGRLRLLGPLHDAKIEGEVRFTRGSFTRDLDWARLLLARMDAQPAAPRRRERWDPALNIQVSMPGNFWVRNSILNGEFALDGRLVGRLSRPALSGSARALRGVFQANLVPFTIRRASALFEENRPFVPYLLVDGEARKSPYMVRVQASGPPDDLELQWSSTPPLTEAQIIQLITTGRVTREGELEGGASAAWILSHGLRYSASQTASRSLALDGLELRPVEDGEAYESELVASKNLTDFLTVQQYVALEDPAQSAVGATVRLSDRLSLAGRAKRGNIYILELVYELLF